MENFTFTRIGSPTSLNINCLLVAATNRATSLKELQYLMGSKVIRSDVGNRFEGRLFSFPPLRERPLEILPAFISKIYDNYKKAKKSPPCVLLTVKALELLLHFNFPGNFRQLDGIAKGLVRLIDFRKEKQELQISLQHMHQCLFLGSSNCVDEPDPDFVEISVSFPNARSCNLWQGINEPGRKLTRPVFEFREFLSVQPLLDPAYRFVVKQRGKSNDQESYFKRYFFDLLNISQQSHFVINAFDGLISAAKAWFSKISSLPKINGRGRTKDYGAMQQFSACVWLMSKAPQSAYVELTKKINSSSDSSDERFQIAHQMLAIFVHDDELQRCIDWEFFVTIVFLCTGFDIRTDTEKKWMNWVADRRGLVRLAF